PLSARRCVLLKSTRSSVVIFNFLFRLLYFSLFLIHLYRFFFTYPFYTFSSFFFFVRYTTVSSFFCKYFLKF
uniref:Uncharacterized protein n=1 Tax=Anopheles arabiensis TaxID=7173 RepID=A0A182IG82_ANOAR